MSCLNLSKQNLEKYIDCCGDGRLRDDYIYDNWFFDEETLKIYEQEDNKEIKQHCFNDVHIRFKCKKYTFFYWFNTFWNSKNIIVVSNTYRLKKSPKFEDDKKDDKH